MTQEKKCFICKEVKPLTEYYKHSAMADGHLNKCKECTKEYVKKYRVSNIEKVRAYDRERGKRPKRRMLIKLKNKRRCARDKNYTKCHNAVTRAVKKRNIGASK